MKPYTDHNDLKFLSESALESSLAGYWDWNMLNDQEYLSPRFKEMFGYEDSEMENKPEAWQKIAFPEDLPIMFASFQKHIDSKGTIPFKSIVRYHHKNGGIIWVRCNGKVVEWTEDGRPARAVGCHVDITEEKERELKLEKTIAERDILLSEVHHRVKNNLQLILSLARMKQKDNKVAFHEIEDFIISIADAYEAVYKTEKYHELVISDYLNKIIKPLAIRHNILFNLDADIVNKNIDFLIPIGLIISECVNNSIKHGYPNKSQNRIFDLSIKEKDHFMHIIYKDNGQGFNEKTLNSTNDLDSDSFGISIIISLVEQLNGEIYFSNEDGAKIQIKLENNSNTI
jgi:PAS domain S-box-containing protein